MKKEVKKKAWGPHFEVPARYDAACVRQEPRWSFNSRVESPREA